MLQNRPNLRTIALAVALCAMSTTVCTHSVQAKGGSDSKQAQSDNGSSGANAKYLLNALGNKKHKKCKKSSGSAAVSFETIKSDTKYNYKAGLGVGLGSNSNSVFAPGTNQDSKSDSKSGGKAGFGWGNMFGGNKVSNKNSKSNSTSNSNSGSGSGSAGFGWGMFGNNGSNTNNSNATTGSTSGSGSNSGSGFGLGSLFGNNSNNNSGSNNGSGNGTLVPPGSGSGAGTPIQLPAVSNSDNGSNGSRNPNIPRVNPSAVDVPNGRLTDEYINGRNVSFDEYTKRLQRWAATGQTVTPGGTGNGVVIPNPPIVRRPILLPPEEENSTQKKQNGGGGGAGSGAGFLASTSGLFMQQAWNAMHQRSATVDANQTRQPDGGNANSLYVSLPSADRTMQRPFVVQTPGQAQDNKNCGGGGGCSNKGQQGEYDQDLKPREPETPVKTGQWALAEQVNKENFFQDIMSPQSQASAATAAAQSQCQGAGEAGAAGTVEGLEQALMVMFLPMSTVNVANEAAGTPGSTLTPFRPLSQAIWMVQRMYKQVFMPMAILLLLPGALILNLKVMIQAGVNKGGDEDSTSPFSAIMRSMIAVFLIPATQLIVSYASDIGSAMTHEVSGATKVMALVAWAKTAMGESMTPLNGEAAGISNMAAGKAVFSAVMNTVSMTLAYGLLMLIAFQITIMCYLMCMGPIAAAFYVYPTGVGRLFKPVFANWVDAVINIALWKFWWCVIVLCMVTRINLMTFVDINPEWEAYMFVCFLVMMSYVPFCPFECKPGEMVDKILQKAQELKKSAGDQNG